jgi:hypothetical protein
LTKEELEQIYHINKEIRMWQKELDKLECKSLIKAQRITGMPFITDISDPTFNIVAEKERYQKIIEGLLAKIQIARRKIMEYIEGIDDSLLRQIIFLRNISCMNWNQIAGELGSNENCVKQIYSRHFRKEITNEL